MKQILIVLALLLGASFSVQAQATKACCAGKEKTACVKKAADKACCTKGDKASCAKTKAASSATSLKVSNTTDQVATFKVYGVCGMCKRTIENALADVEGVSSADWNLDAKMLTVAYNNETIDLDAIKSKVAAAGYDSDTHRASDEAYDQLHACCKYERPRS
jgi:mercuric ion binding protein